MNHANNQQKQGGSEREATLFSMYSKASKLVLN